MEAQKKFEVGQFWKDNHGDKHQICDIDDKRIYTFDFNRKTSARFNLDGMCFHTDCHLTEPWQEPRSGEVWVNVYCSDAPSVHFTKNQAEAYAVSEIRPSPLLATIKMPWKEGQFDE
jgi:hypothetical protein